MFLKNWKTRIDHFGDSKIYKQCGVFFKIFLKIRYKKNVSKIPLILTIFVFYYLLDFLLGMRKAKQNTIFHGVLCTYTKISIQLNIAVAVKIMYKYFLYILNDHLLFNLFQYNFSSFRIIIFITLRVLSYNNWNKYILIALK